MPWPMNARTTPILLALAWASMARPMSLSGRPGRTASMPFHMHSSVTCTRLRLTGSTLPTRKVALVSPCTPST